MDPQDRETEARRLRAKQEGHAAQIRHQVDSLNKALLDGALVGLETELDITDVTSIDTGRITGIMAVIRVRI